MSLKDEDENSDQYKYDLLSALSTDMPASDCLVSLFWSALTNYRHDTVLRPFPSQYILTDGTKDVDGLVSYKSSFYDIPVYLDNNKLKVIYIHHDLRKMFITGMSNNLCTCAIFIQSLSLSHSFFG